MNVRCVSAAAYYESASQFCFHLPMVLLACIGVWPALDSDLVLHTLVLLVTL